jgi:hypothetical protein
VGVASPLMSTANRFHCAMRSVSNSRITSSTPAEPRGAGPSRVARELLGLLAHLIANGKRGRAGRPVSAVAAALASILEAPFRDGVGPGFPLGNLR